MAVSRKKKRVKRRTLHGEDHLAGLEAIEISLESGETLRVRMSDELAIPDDPDERVSEAQRAPARLAFWMYQAERVLHILRGAERELARIEGLLYKRIRTDIDEHTTDMPTEGNIHAQLAYHPDLIPEKEHVDRLRKRYGVLRSLRDALEHRAYVLRRLIAPSRWTPPSG